MNKTILITALLACVALANLTYAQFPGEQFSGIVLPETSIGSTCAECSSGLNSAGVHSSGLSAGEVNVGDVNTGSPNTGGLGSVGILNGFFNKPRSFNPVPTTSGRYRTLFGGWNLLEDHEGDSTASQFRDGFILGTARGRYIGNNNRIELENSWTNNSGSLTPNGIGFDGHFSNISTTFNVLHDINPDGLLGFYAGGGIGFSRQDADFTSEGQEFELEDFAFAYQAIFGFNYRVTGHGSDLYIEYRYMGNTETDIELNDVDFDTFEHQTQNIIFGIRIKK